MDTTAALAVFAALSQATRLEVFRLLVDAGPQGIAAGAVAAHLGVVASTLSHHLGVLERAGLACTRRDGRFVYYAAAAKGTRQLLAFVTSTCGTIAAPVAVPPVGLEQAR